MFAKIVTLGLLAVALFACAAALCPGVIQAALIADGGFETPVLPSGAAQFFTPGQYIGPWLVLGSGGANVALIQTNYSEYNGVNNGLLQFNAQEGLNSLDLTGAGNTGPTSGVQQTIGTTLGQAYLVSFYVGRAAGNGYYATAATDDLSINGGPRVPFTNSNATPGHDNWQEFTYTFTATGPSTTITFYNDTPYGTNEAGLDNVNVTPVPEPASLVVWGLLGAGWVGVNVLRGRRGMMGGGSKKSRAWSPEQRDAIHRIVLGPHNRA
ncbi:MAG: DUF642 domain-containing protein [Thermoguttaceae bacterium]|jgi:hypothetical protein